AFGARRQRTLWYICVQDRHASCPPSGPGVIAADDVDAVDELALDGRRELEHGDVAGEDLLRVVKRAVDRVAGQRLGGRTEGHSCNVLAAWWGLDDSARRRRRRPPAERPVPPAAHP